MFWSKCSGVIHIWTLCLGVKFQPPCLRGSIFRPGGFRFWSTPKMMDATESLPNHTLRSLRRCQVCSSCLHSMNIYIYFLCYYVYLYIHIFTCTFYLQFTHTYIAVYLELFDHIDDCACVAVISNLLLSPYFTCFFSHINSKCQNITRQNYN